MATIHIPPKRQQTVNLLDRSSPNLFRINSQVWYVVYRMLIVSQRRTYRTQTDDSYMRCTRSIQKAYWLAKNTALLSHLLIIPLLIVSRP